jgi:hypothetical protein
MRQGPFAVAIPVADLQRQLEHQAHELIEARELQTATAEVLRVISISPHDIQPVFDTIAKTRRGYAKGGLPLWHDSTTNFSTLAPVMASHPKGSKPFDGCFRGQLAMTRLQDAQSCVAPSRKFRMC